MLTVSRSHKLSTGSFPHAGTFGPQVPLTSHVREAERKRRVDPSSSNRIGNYPIPSFFEYRLTSRSYDIL